MYNLYARPLVKLTDLPVYDRKDLLEIHVHAAGIAALVQLQSLLEIFYGPATSVFVGQLIQIISLVPRHSNLEVGVKMNAWYML